MYSGAFVLEWPYNHYNYIIKAQGVCTYALKK